VSSTDENAYSLVINNHGGSQNAYTTREHTNYIFDVSKDHLRDVLDRFAQFFVAPLCVKSAVDRELNAVNNENEKVS
jgi:secreted Zn-dependent insulinase-like peptidase